MIMKLHRVRDEHTGPARCRRGRAKTAQNEHHTGLPGVKRGRETKKKRRNATQKSRKSGITTRALRRRYLPKPKPKTPRLAHWRLSIPEFPMCPNESVQVMRVEKGEKSPRNRMSKTVEKERKEEKGKSGEDFSRQCRRWQATWWAPRESAGPWRRAKNLHSRQEPASAA